MPVPCCACVRGMRRGVWESYSGREHLALCVPLSGVCEVVVWVLQGVRWMPGYREPKKDVAVCDKPRGVGKRAVIRGCPNGGTWPGLCLVARA